MMWPEQKSGLELSQSVKGDRGMYVLPSSQIDNVWAAQFQEPEILKSVSTYFSPYNFSLSRQTYPAGKT